MNAEILGFFSAIWLGILTSISPCPLAMNVAAISFIAKRIIHPKLVFISGCAYTSGRMISYSLLGFLIIRSLLSVPILANFLQKNMNKAFGPILVITGIILLDIIKLSFSSFSLSQKHQDKLAGSGAIGSFILGLIFALVFCPVSAALFFGSLIPLSLNHKTGIFFPLIYGIGTGFPVLLFAVVIALGVTSLNKLFHHITVAVQSILDKSRQKDPEGIVA